MHNLPRITFLLGQQTPIKGFLYEELTKLNPDVLPILLNDVINDIARSIFFSGVSRRPDWRLHRVELLKREINMKAWWIDAELSLRQWFGKDALGLIALHTLLSSGDIDTYDNFIVPDVVSFHDIQPFYDHFKEEELLIIKSSGSLPPLLTRVKTISLANENIVAEQLMQIDRELSPIRPAAIQPPEPSDGKS